MCPNLLIARAYVARGARLWVALRGLVTAVLLLGAGDLFRPSFSTASQIVVLSVAIGFVDIHRRRERALLGNLGLGPSAITMFFGVPALLGELLLWRLLAR